jgi:FMN phosphatase YigB (HAD superfamily)
MRIPTPEHIKSSVIDAWLIGKTRDKIASEFNISTGSVSNVIAEWQTMIGVFDANNLRELGLALKKAGITPVQCANGLRINNLLNQLYIDEDHLVDFLNKLYNESKQQRLLPADIARLAKVINDYPEINSSLNDIPKYIKKRRQEKIKLDTTIYSKNQEIEKLDQEKDMKRKEIQDLQDDFDSLRKEMQNEKKDFLLFKNIKEELKKHGIFIHMLEPLIDVIKIFSEMHFKPLVILSEFSDIKAYRDLVENKDREVKELESHIQDLKAISDNYEMKIVSNEPMVQSLKKLENLGFDAFDIKNLERTFSDISKKYNLNKTEIKIKFYRYIDRLYTLLTLEQDILEKTDKLSIMNNEISSGRKIIEKSQPIVFSILQNLLNGGLNEHDILLALKIFKTDLCNNMPFGDITYLEALSKDLDKYKTVRDTLKGLDTKILLKKSYIDKLTLVKTNLETFLFSLIITIYYYSVLLNVQILVQTKLRILLIYKFNYLPLVCIVKSPKILNRSKFKRERNYNNTNNNKNKKRGKNKKDF